MSFSMSGGAFSHNRFDAFEAALLGEAKGYQEGGEVKGCEGDCKKDCDDCDKKKSAKKGKKSSGARPDFLDVDKDGDKEEDMKDAIEDNGGAVSESLKHREADTGKVVDKAEIGKIYYPAQPKKQTSVAKRKEAEKSLKKEDLEATGLFTTEEIEQIQEVLGLGKKLSPEAKAQKDREKKLKEAERIAKQLSHPFSDVAKTGKVKRATLKKEGFSDEEIDALMEMTEDELRDRRQERGGVDGNVDYKRAPKPQFTKGPKKKYDGMSALDFVKKDIEKKYGKGAILDTSKKKEK